jgi:hypothetical protein
MAGTGLVVAFVRVNVVRVGDARAARAGEGGAAQNSVEYAYLVELTNLPGLVALNGESISNPGMNPGPIEIDRIFTGPPPAPSRSRCDVMRS